MLLEALASSVDARGEQDPETRATLVGLTRLYADQGRWEEAEEMAERLRASRSDEDERSDELEELFERLEVRR